jgi:hypothetical protein
LRPGGVVRVFSEVIVSLLVSPSDRSALVSGITACERGDSGVGQKFIWRV